MCVIFIQLYGSGIYMYVCMYVYIYIYIYIYSDEICVYISLVLVVRITCSTNFIVKPFGLL